MALTISDIGNGTSASSSASVATGSTVTASIGDWLVAVVAGDNNGTNGAVSLSSVTDSQSNTWTQRALINNDPGPAATGATLGIYTASVTNALSSGTVTANFSPNTSAKAIEVYRVQPGANEAVQFVAADATGSTGSATSHTAATVSVTNGNTIFGCAAIEDRGTITGDSDTTNGSWSSIITRLADNGSAGNSMCCSSQYKTVTGTGNQSWECTSSAGRDSARSYLVLGPVAQKVLVAGAGAHTFSNTAVTLKNGKALTAAAAAHTFSGATVTLKHAWKIGAGQASHSFSNADVTLKHAFKISVDAAAHIFAGTDVSLVYISGKTITAGPGAHTFANTSVNLLHAWKITAGAAGHTFAGTDVTLKLGRKLAAGAGAHTFSNTDVSLARGHKLTAGAGSHSFSNTSVSLKRAWKIGVDAASHTFQWTGVTLRLAEIVIDNGRGRAKVSASGAKAQVSGRSMRSRVSASRINAKVTIQ